MLFQWFLFNGLNSISPLRFAWKVKLYICTKNTLYFTEYWFRDLRAGAWLCCIAERKYVILTVNLERKGWACTLVIGATLAVRTDWVSGNLELLCIHLSHIRRTGFTWRILLYGILRWNWILLDCTSERLQYSCRWGVQRSYGNCINSRSPPQ